MLLCRAARWATLCRQAPKAAAVDAAQRVLWPAHAVPHRSTDMKAPRRCSVECAHGTGTCLRGRKGAPRARCGCTRGACWFFAKAVHSHGYAMASCMRNRTIALFTTRHLAEVPADLGRGIEGAQASTEQQPIVRLSSILGPCDICIEYVEFCDRVASVSSRVPTPSTRQTLEVGNTDRCLWSWAYLVFVASTYYNAAAHQAVQVHDGRGGRDDASARRVVLRRHASHPDRGIF